MADIGIDLRCNATNQKQPIGPGGFLQTRLKALGKELN
jgi:hypothetical protein